MDLGTKRLLRKKEMLYNQKCSRDQDSIWSNIEFPDERVLCMSKMQT